MSLALTSLTKHKLTVIFTHKFLYWLQLTSTVFYKMMTEDDSDDELDELLTKRVFRVHSRDKTKGLENLSQETAALTQETASLTQETNDAKSPSSRTLLPEEIEVKAQRAIEGLNFPLVEHISRIDQLGWYKTRTKKGKKEATWFPCRKCHVSC